MDIFKEKTIIPMLAKRSNPFDSEDYFYEIKWDGIRCLAYINGDINLRSRNNKNITQNYPEFDDMQKWVKNRPLILDGEIVMMKNGKPSFHEWQKRSGIKDKTKLIKAVKANPAVFMVFDILYINGENMFELPLHHRKEVLSENIKDNTYLIVSDVIVGNGIEIYKAAVKKELEGIVAKKKDSLYYPGKRTNFWYKFKKSIEEDFIICGYLKGGQWGIGSLVLGRYFGERLVYQGTVGTGFKRQDSKKLLGYFKKSKTENPFVDKGTENLSVTWVRPELVCTVEYLEKGKKGLRHASFKGIRLDREPGSCLVKEYK